jgi:hypothetical protein
MKVPDGRPPGNGRQGERGLMGNRPRFVLVLEDVPPKAREGMLPPTPAPIRLRQLLKMLLRLHGFRCREVREIPPDRTEPQKPRGQHDESLA